MSSDNTLDHSHKTRNLPPTEFVIPGVQTNHSSSAAAAAAASSTSRRPRGVIAPLQPRILSRAHMAAPVSLVTVFWRLGGSLNVSVCKCGDGVLGLTAAAAVSEDGSGWRLLSGLLSPPRQPQPAAWLGHQSCHNWLHDPDTATLLVTIETCTAGERMLHPCSVFAALDVIV